MTEVEELRIHSELQKHLELRMLSDALQRGKRRAVHRVMDCAYHQKGSSSFVTLTLKGLHHPGRFVEAGRTTL